LFILAATLIVSLVQGSLTIVLMLHWTVKPWKVIFQRISSSWMSFCFWGTPVEVTSEII
jgi:hypothetical protein